jgi:hypothetical protein
VTCGPWLTGCAPFVDSITEASQETNRCRSPASASTPSAACHTPGRESANGRAPDPAARGPKPVDSFRLPARCAPVGGSGGCDLRAGRDARSRDAECSTRGEPAAVYTLNQLHSYDWLGWNAAFTAVLPTTGLGARRNRMLPAPLAWATILIGASPPHALRVLRLHHSAAMADRCGTLVEPKPAADDRTRAPGMTMKH